MSLPPPLPRPRMMGKADLSSPASMAVPVGRAVDPRIFWGKPPSGLLEQAQVDSSRARRLWSDRCTPFLAVGRCLTIIASPYQEVTPPRSPVPHSPNHVAPTGMLSRQSAAPSKVCLHAQAEGLPPVGSRQPAVRRKAAFQQGVSLSVTRRAT